MEALSKLGLGLSYAEVRLGRTTEDWVIAGASLRDHVADVLAEDVEGVEQIGSTSVVGLLAKPIVDLAVGVAPGADLGSVTTKLEADEWIYRGDARDEGGHLFVLETRPWFRVAHLHVVAHHGQQWNNYLQLRDLLRRQPEAVARYEHVKMRLARENATDREAYTIGKTEVVRSLLDEIS